MLSFISKRLDETDVECFYRGEHEVFGRYDAWSMENCKYELTSKDRYYIGLYACDFDDFNIAKDEDNILNIFDYEIDFKGKLDNHILAAWGGISTFNDSDLMTIAVCEKFRGYGLAKIILEKLIEKAKELRLRVIFLEVRESNIGAIKLYEKYGFSKIGLRKNYYKAPLENAVIMQLPINKIGVVGAEIL